MNATDNTVSQAYLETENLLQLLPTLSDEQLKQEYFNNLKLTELIPQLLQLVVDEA